MLPKSKRAKRRNRSWHDGKNANGFRLYYLFRYYEFNTEVTSIVCKDFKYSIFAYLAPTNIRMKGGIVVHG